MTKAASSVTRIFAIILLFISMLYLTVGRAEAIELAIKNNFSERDEGSVLVVDDAISVEAPANKIRFEILPGETKSVTGGNVKRFYLERVFSRHKLKYEIECDPNAKGQKTLTVLDVHEERLPRGCKLSRRGHWSKRMGLSWDEY